MPSIAKRQRLMKHGKLAAPSFNQFKIRRKMTTFAQRVQKMKEWVHEAGI